MTRWFYEYEVEVDDEKMKQEGIQSEELEFLEAIRSFGYVKNVSFSKGITDIKRKELTARFSE